MRDQGPNYIRRCRLLALVLTTSLALWGVPRRAQAATAECLAAFQRVPAGDENGGVVTCTDCDPACDTDGARNGSCVFRFDICLNRPDPSGRCPADITKVRVKGMGVSGTLTPSATNPVCGTFVATVGTEGRRSRPRAGRAKVTVTVAAAGKPRKWDKDTLRLVCNPQPAAACPTRTPASTSTTTTMAPVTTSTTTITTVTTSTMPATTSTVPASTTTTLPPCGNGRIDPGEDCDPPGSACASAASCDETCRCPAPPGVTARWTVPAPAMAGSGEEFPLALEITGPIREVSGHVTAYRADHPFDSCLGQSFAIHRPDGSGWSDFSGAPGTFEFTATGIDCQGPHDYYLVASFWFVDAEGKSQGPLLSPRTTTRLLAPTAPLLRVSPGELTFAALVGSNPPAQTVRIERACGGVLSWTAADDAPWASADPARGTTSDARQATVSLDTSGLDPAQSPFAATVTVSSPEAANSPLTIPLTLHLGDAAARWATPPPATVASGQAFPLALEVAGTVQRVSGRVVACRTDVSVDECAGGPFAIDGPDGSGWGDFSGDPGTFDFTATGIDCHGPNDYYFVASFRFVDADGASVGPFFSPLASTRLLAPPAPLLRVWPNRLTFHALAGSDPPAGRVEIGTACGDVVTWTAAGDAPWLSEDPTSGTASSLSSPAETAVAADTTGLDPADGPFTASVTVSSPEASNSPLTIPVTLDVRGDVTARWTTPAPAMVASAEAFPLGLEVTGPIQKVSGHVTACRTDVPVDRCRALTGGPGYGLFAICSNDGGGIFEGTFSDPPADVITIDGPAGMGRSEFSGPPGTFTFTASGADCQGPNDYYFVASLWFMDTGGAFVGPFFSPPTTTRLLAPTAPLLRVFPGELTFNGLAGINPLAQTLQIRTVCGEVVSWTVADDAPWLSKDATSGTTPAQPLDPSRTRVAVDATGLDPGKVPFTATVAVSSPQAGNSPLAIPITLNLAP